MSQARPPLSRGPSPCRKGLGRGQHRRRHIDRLDVLPLRSRAGSTHAFLHDQGPASGAVAGSPGRHHLRHGAERSRPAPARIPIPVRCDSRGRFGVRQPRLSRMRENASGLACRSREAVCNGRVDRGAAERLLRARHCCVPLLRRWPYFAAPMLARKAASALLTCRSLWRKI
jgi:hypothetical protein